MSALNTRDLRFDAIRGFALLLITIDHIEWFSGSRLLQQYTLHDSDAATPKIVPSVNTGAPIVATTPASPDDYTAARRKLIVHFHIQ